MIVFIPLSLVLSLQYFGAHAHVLQQRQGHSSGALTTFAASLCAAPSCTVTPAAITSLTFTPPTLKVTPSGALSAVEISFTPVSHSSYQPTPVTLKNSNPKGTLTLGRATVSGLKATATASYTDSHHEHRRVVVVADVIGEVQLSVNGRDRLEPLDSCPYVPDLGTVLRRSDAEDGSLNRRSYQILESPKNQLLIQQTIADARTILQAAYKRLSAIVDNNNDIGFTKWFPKSQSARLLGMIAAQLRALNPQDHSIQAVFSTLDERPDTAIAHCGGASGPIATTFFRDGFVSHPSQPPCNIEGWTILCQKWIANYKKIDSSLIKRKLGFGCKSDIVKALEQGSFDFTTMYGSGARTIIHELSHYEAVCAAIRGWNTNKSPSCNTNPKYAPEVYDAQEMLALVDRYNKNNNDDFVLYNADNYALAIMEWYIRDQCKMNSAKS